eukprot:353588-Chlamydomonas_euryale.AAC.10
MAGGAGKEEGRASGAAILHSTLRTPWTHASGRMHQRIAKDSVLLQVKTARHHMAQQVEQDRLSVPTASPEPEYS